MAVAHASTGQVSRLDRRERPGTAMIHAAGAFLVRRQALAAPGPRPPVTFLIVPSRGLLGRSARYDLPPLSYA